MEKTEKKAIVEKAVSMLANDEWDKFQNLYTIDENSLKEHLVDYLFWADNRITANDVISHIRGTLEAHDIRDIFADTLKEHNFIIPTADTKGNEALIIARMAHGSHLGIKSASNKVAKANNIQIKSYKCGMGYISFCGSRI